MSARRGIPVHICTCGGPGCLDLETAQRRATAGRYRLTSAGDMFAANREDDSNGKDDSK